ncbi:DUF2637 domain-containing protein [Polymorphospora sp. NPDC050346]|uniref:DUF2637 domain-containing protein n=1 Tax=Polymorphospora sp. NPDC050346 TaxID=3155780 RepID=UPI0033E47BC6
MTAAAPAPPRPEHATVSRAAIGVLLTVVAILLTVVILAPIALSSQDLIAWAGAPTGLNLPRPWPWLVFVALDAAAGVCVLLTVYCAWRGEPAGIFGLLVWCFAFGSAFANWRYATAPGAAPDAWWFFPAMSLAGPVLLEAVLGRFRRWFQRDSGRRGRRLPTFGWRRWTPGLGAVRDTYGAYRTALLLGIETVDEAIVAYHRLCPDGSLRVAAALRHRDATHQQPAGALPPDAEGDNDKPPYVSVDLMRRIPVDPDAYQRWRDIWADLRGDEPDLADIASRYSCSRRQIEFVRRAGQAGLLESPIPTALRLTHDPGHTSRSDGTAPLRPAS